MTTNAELGVGTTRSNAIVVAKSVGQDLANGPLSILTSRLPGPLLCVSRETARESAARLAGARPSASLGRQPERGPS